MPTVTQFNRGRIQMRNAELVGPRPLLPWPYLSVRAIKGRTLHLSEPQFLHLSSGETAKLTTASRMRV